MCIRDRENTSASMGSRVGSVVGAVMDTKNKVRDSASSLKENVKNLPTQAGYAVHSAKQKAKDNVSDFKRGVVEERENRQEQRTQKRNLHRENISQKKQELQKAQEARQTIHANGSAFSTNYLHLSADSLIPSLPSVFPASPCSPQNVSRNRHPSVSDVYKRQS